MAVDLYGRSVGEIGVGDMASALGGPVKTVTETSSPGTEAALARLYDAINNVATKIDPQARSNSGDDKNYAQTIIDYFKSTKPGASKDKGDKTSDIEIKYLQKMADSSSKLWNASQKQNTIWFGLAKLSSRAQKQIADAIKLSGCCGAAAKGQAQAAMMAAKGGKSGGGNVDFALKAATKATGAAGAGGGGGGSGATPPGSGGAVPGGGKAGAAAAVLGVAADALKKLTAVHKMMVGAVDLDPFKHIFSNAIGGANTYREEMRAMLHQQQGFNAENRATEQNFMNIEASVRASGVRADEFGRIYLRNAQRGLELASAADQQWASQYSVAERAGKLRQRQEMRMRSITTSALSTATALGMEAGTINDLFMDWHMHLGASSLELADMGRHMQGVARDMGVTGKQLEKAVQSSDKVMRSLKSAGSFSGQAGKNVMSMMAAMEKYGVGERGGQMMQGLSSRHAFMNEASPEMRGMLARIGMRGGRDLTNAVQSGTVLTNKDQTRQFGQAMEAELGDFMGQFRGSIEGMGVAMPTSMAELSATIRQLQAQGPEGARLAGVIDQQMRNRFAGQGVGDMEQMVRAMREASMTSGDRINKITQDMAAMAAQGRQNTEAYRQLQRQQTEAVTNQQLTAFTNLQQQMRDAGVSSWNNASAEFRAQVQRNLSQEMGPEQAAQFLANLGDGANNLVTGLAERARAQGANLDELLRARGTSMAEVQQKMASGDSVQMEEAQDALNQATQELQRRERAAQDPVSDIRRILTDWNTKLFSSFLNISGSIGNVAAKILYIGGFIVSVLAEILIALGSLMMMKSLVSGMSGLTSLLGGSGPIAGAVGGIGASTAAATAGAIIGPLMLIGGGIKGALEAEAAGRTRSEGILLGALTGGADTGSALSPMLGIEKGSTADEALGVASASTWGAAAGAALGAAIGVWFFGVGAAPGAAIGAAIGAIVGGGMELVKILTKGTDFIQRHVIRPFEAIVDGIWMVLKGVWDIVAGIFTLDINRIGSGISKILQGIIGAFIEIVKWAIDSIIRFIMAIPNMILGAIRWVIVEGINWIANQISNIFESLANNEYIGAIFKPIQELWETIRNIWDQIYEAIVPVLDSLISAWNEVKAAVMSVIGPLFDMGGTGSFLGEVFSYLGEAIKVLANIIGWVLKVVLWPFIKVFQGIGIVVGWVIQGITAFVNFVKPIFKWLWDVISGVAEILWLFIKILAWPFIKVFEGLSWVFGKVIDIVGWFIGKIVDGFVAVWDFISPALQPLWEGIKLIGDGFVWLWESAIKPVWDAVCAIFETVGGVVMGIVNGIKSAFQWLYDVLYGHSIVPDLIQGIIGLFARLPIAILSGLASLGLQILESIGGFLLEIPKMVLGVVDNLLGGIPGKIVGAVGSALRSLFGGLIDFLGGALGGLIQGVGNIVRGFRETNEQAEARIAESGPSVTSGLGRTAGGLWDTLTGGSEGFFSLSGRWEGLKKTFGGAWETIRGVGSALWDGAKNIWGGITSVFGSITDTVGGWLSSAGSFLGDCWDGVTGFFGGIADTVGGWIEGAGSFLGDCWDGITGFFGGIGDFFGGAVEGIGGVLGGVWDSVTGALGSVAEGIGGFLGDMASGVAEFFDDPVGSIGSGISNVVSGAGEVLGSIGDSVGSAVSSIGSAIAESPINPLNWFDQGTKQVEQGGLAVLHPGEMIIPQSVWEQIKAVGSGAFGNGGGITDSFSNIFSGLGSMFGGGIPSIGGGLFDSIGSMFGFGTPEPEATSSGGGWWSGIMDTVNSVLGINKPEATQDITKSQKKGFEVYDPTVAQLLQALLDEITYEAPTDMTLVLDGAFGEDQPLDAIDAGISTTLKQMSTDLTDKQPDLFGDVLRNVFGGWGDPLLDWMGVSTQVAEEGVEEQGNWFDRMFREMSGMSDSMTSFEQEPFSEALAGAGGFIAESAMDAAQSALEGAGDIAAEAAEGLMPAEPEGMLVFDPTIAEILADIFEGVDAMPTEDNVSTALLGAFGGDQPGDAMMYGMESENKKMFSYWDTISQAISNPLGALKDAFGSDRREETGGGNWWSNVTNSVSDWWNNLTGGSSSGGSSSGSWLSNLFGGSGGLSSLTDSFSSYTSSLTSGIGQVFGGLGMGLFDPMHVSDATDQASYQKQQYYNATFAPAPPTATPPVTPPGAPGRRPSIRDRITDAYSRYSTANQTTTATQSSQGLFNAESNITEAMSSGVADKVTEMLCTGINNCISSAIDTKRAERTENIVAEVSEALNYERSASEAANSRLSNEVTTEDGSDVSPNLMDYTEALRGEVGTLGLSRTGMESTVERERYGEQTQARDILPSMDAIADYLINLQSGKLDDMIELLAAIKENTMMRGGGGGSTIIGKMSDGVAPGGRPGIKNIARDNSRGFWDLNFGDESPAVVNTEGRGGSA